MLKIISLLTIISLIICFLSVLLYFLRKIDFNKFTDGYHFDTEIIIHFKLKKLKITEISIPTHYSELSNKIGFIDSLKYGVNILRLLYFSDLRIKD